MNQVERKDVLAYVKKKYSTNPEYLWKKHPTDNVLRNKENGKWYAVIMNVEKKKLGLEGDGVVDIINLKCNPNLIGSLRERKGFLPAYHMNKENWITILLDGSVSGEEIFCLTDLSYEMIAKNNWRKLHK